jgi:hypothetical protein
VKLDRKLMSYAAGAAGAVAAGLAATESADAAIVVSPGFDFGVASTNHINFDQSGIEEFNLGHERANNNPDTDRVILKEPQNGAMGEGYVVGDNPFPAALPAGTLIGPDSTYGAAFFNNTSNQLADEDFNNDNVKDDTLTGNFLVDNVRGNPQYLGVRFKVNDAGDDRYGWVGVDFTNADDLTGVVTGYAYDDTGAPIEAGAVPEPASGLALLALGAAGLLRRKRA